jgi:hypothetical protein
MTQSRPARSITGAEYRLRCDALGLSVTVLAELLGINRRGLHKRFVPESVVRTEAVLALEMLEHRVLALRYDRIISGSPGGK